MRYMTYFGLAVALLLLPFASAEQYSFSGIDDPSQLYNEFYNEHVLDVHNETNLTVAFVGCWTGGAEGCSSNDRPEFDIDKPGTAQVQVLYNNEWIDIGEPINLGHIGKSNAMKLSTIERDIPQHVVEGNELHVRMKTFGTWFGSRYDVHHYVMSVGLKSNQ